MVAFLHTYVVSGQHFRWFNNSSLTLVLGDKPGIWWHRCFGVLPGISEQTKIPSLSSSLCILTWGCEPFASLIVSVSSVWGSNGLSCKGFLLLTLNSFIHPSIWAWSYDGYLWWFWQGFIPWRIRSYLVHPSIIGVMIKLHTHFIHIDPIFLGDISLQKSSNEDLLLTLNHMWTWENNH